MQAKLERIIAILLVAILILANATTVIAYTAENIMSENELENQGTSTNNENVEFDVYYEGGKHSNISNIASEDTKLIISLKVKNAGYVKDATVDLSDSNFDIINDGTEQKNVQSIDNQNNKVVFGQISNGENANVTLKIKAKLGDNVSTGLFNRDAKIKLTGTYVNGTSKEINLTGTKTIHKEWNNSAKAILTQNIVKYIPYTVSGKNGLMLQEKLTSKIENNNLPIKDTNIEVTSPIINNEKPEQVIVVANSTKATNGDENAISFSTNNWKYDTTNGKVTITTSNEADTNGNISWKKDSEDEYLVTYIYSSNVYTATKEKTIEINENAKATIVAYNNQDLTLEATTTATANEQNQVNELIDYETKATDNVNKGYMYNNKNAEEANKKETAYTVTYFANISYAKLSDKITFEQNVDNFVTDNEQKPTTIAGTNYTYNKSISVKKNIFEKILGNDGKINIINNGATVATISKDTTEDSDGNLVADITNQNTNKVTIETTQPQSEGRLEITINKAISKNVDYSIQQIKNFKKISTEMTGTASNGNEKISTGTKAGEISFSEPTSKASLTVSNNNLSTVVKNQNVEMRATLETDTIDDALYKNPIIKITFPEYITGIDLKSVNLLYSDELTIKSQEFENRTLSLVLEGNQTKYEETSIAKGPTIVINTDITLDRLTPSKTTELELEYNDENESELKKITTHLNYVAPTGIITVNTANGYSDKGEEITVLNGEKATGTLDTHSSNKVAKINEKLINNYDNTIEDVKILGRVSSKGQTQIDTNTDEGNTFDTALGGAINVSGVNATIYYSTNNSATNDLNDVNNGWTTNITDYSNVKSYLIAVSDSEISKGTSADITYNLNIPEDLTHNNQITTDYKVYYTNNTATGAILDSTVSPSIQLSTGTGPELEVKLTSDIENGGTIKTNQYVKMYAQVKNAGTVDAQNVGVVVTAPEGTKIARRAPELKGYEEYNDTTKTLSIGTIKAGETAVQEYYICGTDTTSTETKNIINKVTATAQGLENGVASNEYNFKLESGKIRVTNEILLTDENNIVKNGDIVTYKILVVGFSETELNNVLVTAPLPKDSTLNRVYLTYEDKEIKTESTDSINIGSLKKGEMKRIEVTFTVGNNIDDRTKIMVTAKADGEAENYSNIEYINKGEASISTEAINPDNQYVTEGNAFEYKLKVTTAGTSNISNISIKDQLPSNVEYINSESNVETEGTAPIVAISQNNGLVETSINNVKPNSVIYLTIHVKAQLKDSSEDGLEITNTATVSADNLEKIQVNFSKYYIEYARSNHSGSEITTNNETGSTEEKDGRYKISGIAWNDSNKNGQRDNEEEKVSGIKVILISKENSNIIKDADSGDEKITTTGTDGEYTFSNLLPGKYIVVFMYDAGQYSLTEYQKKDIPKTTNSDAISMDVQLDGQKQKAGVTDTITIGTSNERNVDIGIYAANKFDLKVDKYINKLTVNTKTTGTKEYSYDNMQKKIAKVEVPAKDTENSSIIVEYKIVITNEGSVDAYVKNIVDYLPKELKFSSELNSNWYMADNGNIYNSSLANTKIEPGQSKDITLIATKKLSSDSIGTVINNNAELFEVYNEYGMADIDSTPNNRATNEDDMSNANIVISVKTGQIIIYTTLITSVILILGVGIFLIKTKLIDKNK